MEAMQVAPWSGSLANPATRHVHVFFSGRVVGTLHICWGSYVPVYACIRGLSKTVGLEFILWDWRLTAQRFLFRGEGYGLEHKSMHFSKHMSVQDEPSQSNKSI